MISTFDPRVFRATSGPRLPGARSARPGAAFGPPVGESSGGRAREFSFVGDIVSRRVTLGVILRMLGCQESNVKVLLCLHQAKENVFGACPVGFHELSIRR